MDKSAKLMPFKGRSLIFFVFQGRGFEFDRKLKGMGHVGVWVLI